MSEECLICKEYISKCKIFPISVFSNVMSLNSRISLQVARKIASCDVGFKQNIYYIIIYFFCYWVLLLVYLLSAGDRVVFTEAASTPGVPIVYRLPEDRHTNPDRLNLDRYYSANFFGFSVLFMYCFRY